MFRAKVVVINDEAYPFRLPFFRALARSSLDLTVLFLSRPPERRWRLPIDLGFDHAYLPSIRVPLRRRSYGERRRAYLAPTLLLHLLRRSPDVVVAYAYSLPTVTAWLYCRATGARLVIWSEGTAHSEAENSAIHNRLRRWLLPAAAACLAGSSQAAERMIELGADPARVHVLAHAADAELFAAATVGGDAVAREVLFVGELSELKGVRDLLEIFARVRTAVPEATLRLVGAGALAGELEARASAADLRGTVRFDGYLQQHELASRYRTATVFAFPTRRDTFGQVVAEAATAGLPMVCSPLAGAAGDLVRDGVNGFVRHPRDHDGFAAALAALLVDDARRHEMGNASRRIASDLAVESVAAATAVRLEQLARRAGSYQAYAHNDFEEQMKDAG